jgi:hypothetical protein
LAVLRSFVALLYNGAVLARKENPPAPPRLQTSPEPDHAGINDLCKQLLDNHDDDEAEIRVVRQLRVAVHDYMNKVRQRLVRSANIRHRERLSGGSNHPAGATESRYSS